MQNENEKIYAMDENGGTIPGENIGTVDTGGAGVIDCGANTCGGDNSGGDSAVNDTPADIDANGVKFDPEVHATREGKPILTAGGTYRYKPGCKPAPKDSAPIFGFDSPPAPAPAPTPAPAPVKAARVNPADLAEISASIFITLGETVAGDGFKPDNEAEKANLNKAFKNYYDSLNLSKFSPASVLCLALSAYTFKKAAKSEVREKSKNFFRKWYEKITGKKSQVTAEK